MPPKLQTLQEIILNSSNILLGALYLQGNAPWSLESLGVVYTYEDGDDLQIDHPDFVRQHNLKDVFPMGTLHEILWNARRQKPTVNLVELVQAFNHYYKHDGFLQL